MNKIALTLTLTYEDEIEWEDCLMNVMSEIINSPIGIEKVEIERGLK